MFNAEDQAWTWIAEQLDRRAAGLEPTKPAPLTGPEPLADPTEVNVPAAPVGELHTLGNYARAWHAEQYQALHAAGPDRAKDVLDDIELHLLPAFDGPIETDIANGRQKIVTWTRRMAGYPPTAADAPLENGAKTYAIKTVNNLLWVLTQILRYAHTLGADVRIVDGNPPMPALTKGITAMKPRGRTKRKAKLVSLSQTARIAAGLHVVHQVALWLMRIAGLRITEAYGLIVANFVDDGHQGYLLIEAIGGRTFHIRDDNERVIATTRKQDGKTSAAYRLIALPDMLSELIRRVVIAFHTDPVTGEVAMAARLVPTIRAAGGGIAGFRTALKKAAAEVHGSGHEDDYVLPHDMRKGYATDLAWDPELSERVKRRAMGHRAGADVFDLVYALDDRLKEAMLPAAATMDRELRDAVGSLTVPTARRPLYGTALCPQRLAYVDAELEGMGWQVNDRGDRITASEAAIHLGLSETATRRLFPKMIPAVKGPDGWLAQLEDVFAYRDRLAGHRMLPDVAAQAGVDYHAAYRTMLRLSIEPGVDEYSRAMLLTDDQADRILGELARIDRLEARSITVARACAALLCARSTVERWARDGDGPLQYDEATAASNTRYITRASVEAQIARRGGRRREATVKTAGLKEAAGLDDHAIRSLIAAKVLVPVRNGELTAASVQSWVTGYRPDLLDWLRLQVEP